MTVPELIIKGVISLLIMAFCGSLGHNAKGIVPDGE
jgi:hypothetical protein